MSLAIAIKGPEGVVLAADSRITLEAKRPGGTPLAVNFDNASKVLSFNKPHNNVGAVTYGAAVIGQRTAHSYIPEFEVDLKADTPLKVLDFAQRLSEFYLARWRGTLPEDYAGPSMVFVVGGYDPGAAYGKVFMLEIPNNPEPQEQNQNGFGMTWGGQLEIVSRLIHGFDPGLPETLREILNLDDDQANLAFAGLRRKFEYPVPFQVLPLQDSVNLAILLIRSTMSLQSLAVGLRGVGGQIEVAIIDRTTGLNYVQRKRIHGEEEP